MFIKSDLYIYVYIILECRTDVIVIKRKGTLLRRLTKRHLNYKSVKAAPVTSHTNTSSKCDTSTRAVGGAADQETYSRLTSAGHDLPP